MLLLRKLVESTAVNAVCVLPLESGLSVLLVSMSECVHVYDLCAAATMSTTAATTASSESPASSSSPTSPPPPQYELRPRGHIFHVGCGVVSLLALTNQCFLIWTRDQECLLVRYQANLAAAVATTTTATGEARAEDNDRVYSATGVPTPVHYKEHHWYVVHRVRLWCPDGCAAVHPAEMGVNDSLEVVYLRFCTGHIFFLSIKWDLSCLPGIAEAAARHLGSTSSSSSSPAAHILSSTKSPAQGGVHSVAPTSPVPSLRTTQWHTGDYMKMYAGTRFHYPTQSCSVATRRPGESAEAHQQRIEGLWQSGSTYANVPDEDLISTHAVMELSKRKTATKLPPASLSSSAAEGGTEKVDWTGVRSVVVRREPYASTSPLMPTPAFYCNAAQGGFTNVRNTSGQLAVHHAGLDFFISRSTAVKDEHASSRVGSLAVSSPRRAGRRGLDWTLLLFLTSPNHTAIFHLQRARTPLGTPHYVLDGLFAGPAKVRQVLFCTHSGDASNDVWVALDSGAVARFAIAELRARGAEAQQVRNVHQFPWPVTHIAGLPSTFVCRLLQPADNLFTPGRGADALISNLAKPVGAGSTSTVAGVVGGAGTGLSSAAAASGGAMGVKSGLFSMYPCTRRYAVLSDCAQDAFVVDLVERRVVAALAGDGPMTDVCEAPHGYVAAYARGVLRCFQPGMQLHVRGTVRLPPYGVPIYFIRATRLHRDTAAPALMMNNNSKNEDTPDNCSAVKMQAGVYVIVSTHHTSQLYRIDDGRLIACTSEAWDYEKNETTLVFEAVTVPKETPVVKGNEGANEEEAEDVHSRHTQTATEPKGGSAETTVVMVQCTASHCRFNATSYSLPYRAFRAAVTVVAGVGAVCVAAFREGPLACSHVAVVTAADGVSLVRVMTDAADVPGLPTCVAARGLCTAAARASLEVVVGRWDSCVTVSEVRRVSGNQPFAAAATAAAAASAHTSTGFLEGSSGEVWRCVASQTLQVPSGKASPVQQLVPLPRAGWMSRWMATHSSGEVSILALGRHGALPQSSTPSSKQEGRKATVSANEVDDAMNSSSSQQELPANGWFFAWAPTSPPYRKAQQKATCGVVPLIRALPVHRPAKAVGAGKTSDSFEFEEDGAEVYNGFDGALLQPRDGALLLFSVALEEGDTQAPPYMQRLRERDEEDREWVVRLENTVRAIVPSAMAGQVRAAPWRCAVLIENVTPQGTLRYDALMAQHDELTLCTLDEHLFAAPYPRQRPTHALTPALPPPRRAFVLACTAPSRYICTLQLRLPQLNPHETLVSIAREPDDEGEGVLLCVTVCEQTALTRLTTLKSGTLAVLDSLVLHGSLARWMSAVPPSTPNIARAAPLFLLCGEKVADGTAQLQVIAAHPLRIASSETLEDSPGWVDAASREVKIDGAVQVVPTRINSDGDTYGGEVLVTVTVDCAIHLFVLRGYTLLFQHCVLAPACTTSVTLCYPIVSVCTEGDSNMYLQVYPVNDDTEVFAPSYAHEASRPLKKYGRVSWKMRVSMREPSFGACVLAQSPLYDRCVRTDVEGDVTVTFINLSSATAKAARAAAAHVKGEDCYVGSAEGPQTFLTHTVRLPAVPVKARLLRHVSAVQRRHPRQLQCSGHTYHLQSSSVRKDRSSRLLLLPCHDGSLYGAFEIPYGFAHPLLRLEQVITDAYALDLSLDVHASSPGLLQHTYHLQPFHVARALQPLVGTRQAEKQACIMVDAVFEYFLLRDLVLHGYGTSASSATAAGATAAVASLTSHDSKLPASAYTGAADSAGGAKDSNAEVVRRKFAALDDVVQTLLTEEYGDECTVDLCAEMLNIL